MKALALCVLLSTPLALGQITGWPDPTAEAKPWTRWWWLGSGVDPGNLTRELETLARAGIGGVEICPIYGAKGYENRDLPFLSPAWLDAYRHTARECERLGLGLDLTTGTGWPFGGPWIAPEQASASLEPWVHDVTLPSPDVVTVPEGSPIILIASRAGQAPLRLESKLHQRRLDLSSLPPGPWQLKGLFSRRGIQKVKRAAPGGAGWVLDPFSEKSMDAYLRRFSSALDPASTPQPRAHFHDSFEYYGAAWTDSLLEEFRRRNGYDLLDQLDAFLGLAEEDAARRVRADYRATLSLLHQRYLERWHSWAARRGSLTRNQAHGSPGNLLDHYAVADIPETEIFRHVDEAQWPMLQFAASAARLTGRSRVSAETFTWLGEHFQVTPAQLKEAIDFVWLGGVNHVFYHGIPYSPQDAPWPGWLFYASTHLGREGGLWRHQSHFNQYISRVQSLLQQGQADSDVLLYFPVHDLWHDGRQGLPLFTVHNQDEWLHPTSFYQETRKLRQAGFSSDFVSDELLKQAQVREGKIVIGGHAYAALILPRFRYLPLETARRLAGLRRQGARIFAVQSVPGDVLGFVDVERRRAELREIFETRDSAGHPILEIVQDAPSAARQAGVAAESWSGSGLAFVRRRLADETVYFIVNRSPRVFSGDLPLTRKGRTVLVMDPMSGRIGSASPDAPLRLALDPGESRLIRVLDSLPAFYLPPWRDPRLVDSGISLDLPCRLEPLEGGPALPPPSQLPSVIPWTTLSDPAYRDFSGVAVYHLTFEIKETFPAVLELGTVGHTARVWLNDHDLGVAWSPPSRFEVSRHLLPGTNRLRIEVANLAANRIAALDRAGTPWKNFHEINFVNIDYKPFDASGWPAVPSGLLAPPRLLRIVTEDD